MSPPEPPFPPHRNGKEPANPVRSMILRKAGMASYRSDSGGAAYAAASLASQHSVQRMEPRSEHAAGWRQVDSTTVALVGLNAHDQASLRKILGNSACPHAANCEWHVQSEASVDAAMAAIVREPISMVVCDRDWMADAWKELLDRFAGLSRPPLLIVASRLADDRLWAEALNLGAYDVVAKPFDAAEVSRIAGLACAQWHGRAAAPAVMHSVA